jgi:Tfp pilus assembly protein PilO
MKAPKSAGVVTKRSLIDKANTTTLVAAGCAAFLVVFSLVSAKALISQLAYQNRVIGAKKDTLKRIDENLKARDSLVQAYRSFTSDGTNIIGGNTSGSSDRDGNNADIILDALPSKYDFPALTASLEKLALGNSLKLSSITGTDDEVNQASQQNSATPKPLPVAFQVKVDGGYGQVQGLIDTFEKSIRPIQVQTFTIQSSDKGLTSEIGAATFYQPEKKLELRTRTLEASKKVNK